MSDSLSYPSGDLLRVKLGPANKFDYDTQLFYRRLVLSLIKKNEPVVIFSDPGYMYEILKLNNVQVVHCVAPSYSTYSQMKLVFVMNKSLTYEHRAALHYDDVFGVENNEWKVPDYERGGNFEMQQALVRIRLEIQNQLPGYKDWSINNDKGLFLISKGKKYSFSLKRQSVTMVVTTLKGDLPQVVNSAPLFDGCEKKQEVSPLETPQVSVLAVLVRQEPISEQEDEMTIDDHDGKLVQIKPVELRYVEEDKDLVKKMSNEEVPEALKLYLNAACTQSVPQGYDCPTRKVLYIKKSDGVKASVLNVDGTKIVCKKDEHIFEAKFKGKNLSFTKCKGQHCGDKKPLSLQLILEKDDLKCSYLLHMRTNGMAYRNGPIKEVVGLIGGRIHSGTKIVFHMRLHIDRVSVKVLGGTKAQVSFLEVSRSKPALVAKTTMVTVLIEDLEQVDQIEFKFFFQGIEKTSSVLTAEPRRGEVGVSFLLPGIRDIALVTDLLDEKPDFVSWSIGGIWIYYRKKFKVKNKLQEWREKFGIVLIQDEPITNFLPSGVPLQVRKV
jgi:hypothetical protein